MMTFHIAYVKHAIDITKSGRFQVICDNKEIEAAGVIYTTPYYKPYSNGGFFAVPTANSKIIVSWNPSLKEAYYISTVMEDGNALLEPESAGDSSNFRTTPIIKEPNKKYEGFANSTLTFTNDEYNGLVIEDRNAKTILVNETRLQNNGKIVSLNSSPQVDNVAILNDHGDGMKIYGLPESAEGQPPLPKRSIETRSLHDQKMVSDKGSIDLKVVDGKDITIENDSTGMNSVGGVLSGRTGNVNVFSKYKNIRLSAKGLEADGGQIILETLTSKIIVSNRGISLLTIGGGIEISVGGAITFLGAPVPGVGGVGGTGESSQMNMPETDLVINAKSIKFVGREKVEIQSVGPIDIESPSGVYLNPRPEIPSGAILAGFAALLPLWPLVNSKFKVSGSRGGANGETNFDKEYPCGTGFSI